jgi:hypothetical protein
MASLAAVLYLVVQLAGGAARVAAVTAADGVPYSPAAYPSIQPDAVDAKTRYDVASIDAALARVARDGWPRVEIDVSDVWIRQYLMTRLTVDGRAFLVRGEVRSYFSTGEVLDAPAPGSRPVNGRISERREYEPAVGAWRYVLTAEPAPGSV